MQNLHDFLTLAAWVGVVLALAMILTAEAIAWAERRYLGARALLLTLEWKRRGGIWFGRAGRLRVSFCIAKEA